MNRQLEVLVSCWISTSISKVAFGPIPPALAHSNTRQTHQGCSPLVPAPRLPMSWVVVRAASEQRAPKTRMLVVPKRSVGPRKIVDAAVVCERLAGTPRGCWLPCCSRDYGVDGLGFERRRGPCTPTKNRRAGQGHSARRTARAAAPRILPVASRNQRKRGDMQRAARTKLRRRRSPHDLTGLPMETIPPGCGLYARLLGDEGSSKPKPIGARGAPPRPIKEPRLWQPLTPMPWCLDCVSPR